MAKLKGKKKAAFLRRMAAGRKKAASAKPRRKTSKKSGPKRRKAQPIKRKSNKRKTSMAKKKGGSRRKNRFGIPSIAKKAATGIGLATIATVLVSQFAPSAAPIVRPIAAFAGGGVVGVVADLFLSGGGILSGLLGGGTPSNQMVESV